MLHVLNNVYVGVHSRSLIAHSVCILAYISMLVQGWHLLETQQETFLVKHGILLDLLLSKNDSKNVDMTLFPCCCYHTQFKNVVCFVNNSSHYDPL